MSKLPFTLRLCFIHANINFKKERFCKSFNRLTYLYNSTGFRNENVTQDFIENLNSAIGKKNVSTALVIRNQYGTDEGCHGSSPSDVVTYPHSKEDVCKIAKLCWHHAVPMIPHGAGTGLELGVGAPMGGVCIDLAHLNSVIDLNADDFDCTVESGISRKTVNMHLRHTGLMFPVDPGADASIGGMVSTSASGTNAVCYGTMKENVLNLEVVLADGTVLHTAGQNRRARKSAAGYNLTELFIGSEGTLGIITKATLRLHAIPERMISAVSSFQSIKDAVQAVVDILQCNIPVARIELMDELSMAISNKYSNLSYFVAPSLFFEFHGSEASTRAQAEQVEEIIRTNYSSSFVWAADFETRNKLWQARHEIYYATLAQKPGYKCAVTDVCVPISNMTEMVIKAQDEIKASGILGSIIGHVGDGNFHTQLLYNPFDEKEIATVHALEQKITEHALLLNGTCTGEHGIGVGKIPHLKAEYGAVGIQCMKLIKKAFDSKNIMNPGKIFL